MQFPVFKRQKVLLLTSCFSGISKQKASIISSSLLGTGFPRVGTLLDVLLCWSRKTRTLFGGWGFDEAFYFYNEMYYENGI